jgi:hypothetical protein
MIIKSKTKTSSYNNRKTFFSKEMKLVILNKIKKTGIENVYVMTPSIFNLQRAFIPFVFSEFYSLIYLLVINSFTKKSNLINSYTTFRRTRTHFIELLKKSQFVLDSENTIMNNNGPFNLFHFKNDTDLKPQLK